jgi:sugar lactone lactonase YvrE
MRPTFPLGPMSQHEVIVPVSLKSLALDSHLKSPISRGNGNSLCRKRLHRLWLATLLAIVLPAATALAQTSFGTHALGTPSTLPVTVTAKAAGTVATVQVLTLGAPNLDYVAGSGGTCTSAVLGVNSTCSQPVTFTPAYPGVRTGAVVLLDSGSNVLGTAFMTGTGSGGLAVFSPGNVIPVAGDGLWVGVKDGGPALNGELDLPSSVTFDGVGNMFIADSAHNRIRRVDAATHIITTIAGTDKEGYSGDGGLAINSTLRTPSGVALDGAGNLYIADTGNNVVRMISAATGIIGTVAGNGILGSAGDTGPATSASLDGPLGVTVDVAGNLFIADTANHRIRKVDSVTSIITTVAGNGYLDPLGTGDGGFAGDNGPATSAELNRPNAVAFDAAGHMYIPDSGNSRVRIVDTTGTIRTFAGSATSAYSGEGGPATAAGLLAPAGVVVDPAQNVYISDTGHHAIRKVSAFKLTIATFVLDGLGKSFYNGALYTIGLFAPQGLFQDGNGNLYIADYFGFRIWEVQSNVGVLDFTATPTRMGDTSIPQIKWLENDGNASFTLAAITPDVNAAIGPSLPTDCVAGSTLILYDACSVNAEFAPSAAGNPLVGNIAIASNSVNQPHDIELVGIATPVNSTTTVLTSSPNPSTFGQNVTLAAAVTTGTGTGALTGTVTFLDGTKTLQSAVPLNSSGIATYSTTGLAVGLHSLTAIYGGDTGHSASGSSNIVPQVVNEQTQTYLVSSANPSALGAAVTFTATVTALGGGVPVDGTVSFNDGATPLGPAVAVTAGAAAFTTTTLSSGVHSITAIYSGDAANYILPSTSKALSQDVQAASTVVVASSGSPSIYGSPVTFTATVTAPSTIAPTGTVNFLNGGKQFGTAPLVGTTGVATFTTSSLPVGSDAITATYVGGLDAGPGTSAPIIQVVNLTQTGTTVLATPNPGIAGKPVALTATVKVLAGSAAVTGTVTFTDGATPLGSAQLGANGTATITPLLAPGPHAIVASYGGDANDAGSASTPYPLAVNLATTTMSIQSSSVTALVLAPVTFTATVAGNGGTPTGAVTFQADGANIGSGTLDATGKATLTYSALKVGSHVITASYAGDANDAASTATLTQVIQAIPTVTDLAATSTTGPTPQLILVATVVGSTGPTPTGTITFNNGSTLIGTVTLDVSGVATLTPDLAPGTYSIIANYSGDADHAPSSSKAVSISGTATGFSLTVTPPKLTIVTSQNAVITVDLNSDGAFADTIGLGCGSLPASVNCHFATNGIALKAGATQSVQLTIDTNNPLSGGGSAMNSRPGSRGLNLAGLFLPASLFFGWIFWRFRRRHVVLFVAALALFLSGAFLVTGCGGYSQVTAAPGTYVIQVTGVGVNSNITHYQNVTLTITK